MSGASLILFVFCCFFFFDWPSEAAKDRGHAKKTTLCTAIGRGGALGGDAR